MLTLILLLLVLSTTTCTEYGVNVHHGGTDPTLLATKMAERNLKHARFDLWGNDPVYLPKFRTAVSALNAAGIKSEAVVFTNFSRGQKRSEDCGADLEEVESTAYVLGGAVGYYSWWDHPGIPVPCTSLVGYYAVGYSVWWDLPRFSIMEESYCAGNTPSHSR
jgi:hypothetical protein